MMSREADQAARQSMRVGTRGPHGLPPLERFTVTTHKPEPKSKPVDPDVDLWDLLGIDTKGDKNP